MTDSLAGKVALVTGGSKGIGLATAKLLHERGASVVISYGSDKQAANSFLEAVGSERAMALQADSGSVKETQMLVDETIKRFKKIDFLIPCAGVSDNVDLEHTTEALFDRAIAVNVKGPYFLTQLAAPHMPPGSHIVFFSTTLTGFSGIMPNYLLYVATKGAIDQMVRVLAKDLGRKGICVNGVAPGPTGTELFYKGKSEEQLKMFAGMNPFGRIGGADDIAKVVLLLCAPDSAWVTGQMLKANGGMV